MPELKPGIVHDNVIIPRKVYINRKPRDDMRNIRKYRLNIITYLIARDGAETSIDFKTVPEKNDIIRNITITILTGSYNGIMCATDVCV